MTTACLSPLTTHHADEPMLVARDQLTEEQLKEALDHCAREPIHIPGSIQPHGMLVVFSARRVIEQISANAREFLGMEAEDCLGRPITDFLEEAVVAGLENNRSHQALEPIQSTVVRLGEKDYDAVAHQSGESIILELEPLSNGAPQNGFYYDQLRNYAIGMHRAKTLEEVFGHVTRSIRTITGFDRVMLYRFDQDWHGEVVAEARAGFMPSYKGLHFPASDIPEQARKLYMQNYLRLIADTQYKPVPVIPAARSGTQSPLDLSLSMLRSVSPVHIQYLENINVKASMSVSIIQNGKLWGLIACHHNSPLHVPYQVRNVCEIMGHIFSAQLSTMEDFAKREAQDKRDKLIRRLSSALDKNTRIDALMQDSHMLAMDALEADGLVVKAYVHILNYGETPPGEVIPKLIDWLNGREESIFYTDDAFAAFKGVPELESLTGGILAIPISTKSHDYIIWFRNAIVEEVSWAGDPEKPIEQTGAGYRLTPRSSFELWKQQVRHRSQAWLEDEIRTARSIVNILLESEKLSAQQANIAKTEFLANMSHEIRTPMNAIIGLSRILSTSQPLTEKQREMLKTLQISADSLMDLINDLLDISKIESRVLELEAIPFSMKKLLQEVISMTSVKALEKGISFTLEDSATLDENYIGDPSRIRQIILNLCSNAVKFTEKGSIRISVSSEHTDREGHKKMCITVRDTGIGIAQEKLQTIFHKFVQADNTISRKYGGTGLGLAITKMLTEVMGGEITVKSEPGKGSEFLVCFDLKVASGETSNPSAPPAFADVTEAPKPRLLIVEDYEPNIMVASHYLDSMGYVYDIARSGVEAVEKFKASRYVAILMDVQMPELNGFDATQLIRQYEASNKLDKTPVIGMTAHALAGDRERCLGAGMDDYVAKPVSEEELRGKLRLFMHSAIPT